MSQWKDWCRFCGNSVLTIKYEFPADIKNTFEISDLTSKICEDCKTYITEFERFLDKSKRVSQLFHELANIETLCLNPEFLNELRKKYFLDPLNFDDWKFIENDENYSDVKDELDSVDLNLEAQEILEPAVTTRRRSKTVSKTPSRNQASRSKEVDKNKQIEKEDLKNKSSFILNMICHVCQEHFSSLHSIMNHCKKVHDCRPQVPCICGKIISRYGTYMDHKKKHLGNNQIIYRCDHCPRQFYHKLKFTEHVVAHGFNGTPRFICNECGHESNSAQNLKTHQLIHLPAELRWIHTCSQCDKKFSLKRSLVSHIQYKHNSDPNKRDFTCDSCGLSFRLKGQLKSHQMTHLEERNVPCPVCRTAFKTTARMKSHMKIHGPKQFQCETCKNWYRTKYQLRKHMVCHTNIKEYKCQHCPNEYKRKKDLMCHLSVHTGARPYSCPFCDRTFVNNSNCRKHKLQSHPDELAAYEMKNSKIKKIH